jgi:hypothetical protein
MYVVVIPENITDVAGQLSQMRMWLDAQRFETSRFKTVTDAWGKGFQVGFNIQAEAAAFAERFGGQPLHPVAGGGTVDDR